MYRPVTEVVIVVVKAVHLWFFRPGLADCCPETQCTMKASKHLDTISIIFNLNKMEGWTQRKWVWIYSMPQIIFSSDFRFIPSMLMSRNSRAQHRELIDEIKAAYSCVEHEGPVSLMAIFHPPLQDLVNSWNGSTSLSRPKPRGRSGPNPAQQAVSSSTSDTTNLLLTIMVPVTR
ncbi:hypothetical protein B0H17DRAFT_1140104 [Mycena rosella]|uniref:Uncharacterized protein n=1 Tax=Mycena rosella TaxID=1033263 RepID=A0AAD7GCB9_MYCRO|nr:hypothetical protein B0H17DRAFT_1140104 [Mycena rosella]